MAQKGSQQLLNFVGGEISALVADRPDLEVLLKSLIRCENFVVLPQGGIRKRPGTFVTGLTKGNAKGTLIPFQFSANDALMIVATDSVFRFYRNDAVVLNASMNITPSKANPCLVYAPRHTYTNGNEVYISSVGGMTQLNGRFFLVAGATTNLKTISAATKANPGVFTTSAAHGFVVGQRVNITNVLPAGWAALNADWIINTTPLTTTFTLKDAVTGVVLDTSALVGTYTASSATVDGSTFTLQDQWGANVDSTNYSTWTSGGAVASIFELATPYQVQDLSYIRSAQTADVMYLTCRNEDLGSSYAPRKLVRQNFTSWTLGVYPRTNDPFPVKGLLSLTATAISKSSPCKVTVATSTLVNGDVVYVESIRGMTELSGNFYLVANKTAVSFTLQNPDGTDVDSTQFTTYTANTGVFKRHTRDPGCVAFSADGRVFLSSTQQNPEGLWGSRTPKAFLTRYDDFTIAASGASAQDPTNGMAFSFSPVDNKIDTIREMKQFNGNFALLGASSIRLVYGAQRGQPPTPIAINTLPTLQGAARVPPLVINWNLIFVDVNQQRMRGLQYNLAYDTFQANDYNLTSEHFGLESPFIRLARIKGTPDIIFCLRQDGVLLACTFNNIENIAGWTRLIPANGGQVVDVSTIRKSNGTDELWLLVQRTMNGKTYTSVEVMDVWPVFPAKDAFFTDETTEAADMKRWANAAWEAGKACRFLDSALTYDGTARGAAASATMTPSSAALGAVITLTSSAAVFSPADVGSQVWKSYDSTGNGGGRALITGYTSATQVTALVKVAFDNTTAIAAGSWAFATNTINNLYLYEGLTVSIQADGGGLPDQVVTSGSISLGAVYASMVHVGFRVKSRAKLPSLDFVQGARSRLRNVNRVFAKLVETIGGRIGTSFYSCPRINFNRASSNPERVPEPFSGVLELPQLSGWGREPKVAIRHDDPTPFTLLYLEPEGLVSEG